MKDCLDTFCDLSGQQVSFPKSRIYCSSNISDRNAAVLANICGSPTTKNLGSYLGVPLIHGRIKKETYRDILEKTQKRLATWKSASLSLAGRCTLIKSVTSAIPVYAMQSIKLPSDISNSLDKINRDFLWGSSVDKRRVHLVNWDTVCLPKYLGGLGIKKTKAMNQALLAKVGWRLVHNNTDLWGRLLKNKYLKGGISPDFGMLKSTNCSSTWRGILFGAKLLKNCMKWRVGNGNSINFWVDNWAPSGGQLLSHASCCIPADRMTEKVSDYFLDNDWNVQKLSSVLPWHIVSCIISVHFDRRIDAMDTAIWGLSNTGGFTVKSAYNGQFRDADPGRWRWDFIWKLKIPPRVVCFLWTLLHGKILSNCERMTRGISSDVTCMRCKVDCEDIEHIFRGCSVSLGIWENISRGVMSNCDFLAGWNDWLFSNLNCSDLIVRKIPNYLLFAVSLWFIWKWRCNIVFNPSFQLPVCPGRFIWKYVVDWVEATAASDKGTVMETWPVSWSPPEMDWVKLNVDGSMVPNLGSISAGGVVRDHRKIWMVGFALNKGTGSVLEAELWGILEGLRLVWKKGFKMVIVESDSKSAVDLLNNNTPICHPLFSLIEACQNMMKSTWTCVVQHVYREGNRVADCLATFGHSLDFGMTIFEEPPLLVAKSLEDDAKGVVSFRMVPSS